MNRHRRLLITAPIATAVLSPIAAGLLFPRAALALVRGDYIELKPPQPTESDGKIEVIEFFWYGCPHCYHLEPMLEAWVKKLPPDVAFRPLPAVFNERWAYDAAIFFAFEALGVLPRVHRAFFDAIHRDNLRTDNKQALAEWLQKQGIDPGKFDETFKSFGVQSKTRRAAQLTVAYRIDGTPAMGVNGRYTVSAGDHMLDTVSQLIEAERKKK